jgi:hypothetical protein
MLDKYKSAVCSIVAIIISLVSLYVSSVVTFFVKSGHVWKAISSSFDLVNSAE